MSDSRNETWHRKALCKGRPLDPPSSIRIGVGQKEGGMTQQQQLIEPRVGVSPTAAKFGGWEQTLELLERGELSNSEVETIMQEELPRALAECTTAPLTSTDAELKEWARLTRVLGKIIKVMQRRLKAQRRW